MQKIEKTEFKLIGLKLDHKTSNEGGQSSIDCGNLWQKFEQENFIESIPDKLSEEIYAVYYDYEGDYTKPFSYFIGCKVKIDDGVPQGMDNLVIPAGSGYSAAKYATIPLQSIPVIPDQSTPPFRWKGYHLFRCKVRQFAKGSMFVRS